MPLPASQPLTDCVTPVLSNECKAQHSRHCWCQQLCIAGMLPCLPACLSACVPVSLPECNSDRDYLSSIPPFVLLCLLRAPPFRSPPPPSTPTSAASRTSWPWHSTPTRDVSTRYRRRRWLAARLLATYCRSTGGWQLAGPCAARLCMPNCAGQASSHTEAPAPYHWPLTHRAFASSVMTAVASPCPVFEPSPPGPSLPLSASAGDDKVNEPLSSGADATVGYFHWKASGELSCLPLPLPLPLPLMLLMLLMLVPVHVPVPGLSRAAALGGGQYVVSIGGLR